MDNPLPLGTALRVGQAIATKLAALHDDGLVHGALHPLAVTVDSATYEVELGPPPDTAALSDVDTQPLWSHLAPERARAGIRGTDPRSDLYALGVILYQLVTGRTPVHATDALGWAHAHLAVVPAAPTALVPTIPTAVTRVILHLLAKDPAERYQTAAGVSHDLARLVTNDSADLPEFEPGARDIPDRLTVPRRLYGRDPELDEIGRAVAAYRTARPDEVSPWLVSVRGSSGVGKTQLVREALRRALVGGGIVLESIAEAGQRLDPYGAIRQIFDAALELATTLGDDSFALLKSDVQRTLGAHVDLVTGVVHGLTRLVGRDSVVVDRAPFERSHRLPRLLVSLLDIVLGHLVTAGLGPVVVFLDDVQWMDDESEQFVRLWLERESRPDALLLVAERLDEPQRASGLLAVARRHAGTVDVVLAPLDVSAVEALLNDMRCGEARALPALSELVLRRTGGAPFDIWQFLSREIERKTIYFDREALMWRWELARLVAPTDVEGDVAAALNGRLTALAPRVRELLGVAACIGREVAWSLLANAAGLSPGDVRQALGHVARDGLITVIGADGFRFAHDRIREAAQAHLTPSARPAVHAAIANALLGTLAPEQTTLQIFALANHVRLGASAGTLDPHLAARVLAAAVREARGRAAFRAAVELARFALALRSGGHGEVTPNLSVLPADETTFDLAFCCAASAWPIGEGTLAEQLFTQLLERFPDRDHQVAIRAEQTSFAISRVDLGAALASAAAALALFGRALPDLAAPEGEQVATLAARRAEVDARLETVEPEHFGNLPVADGAQRALLDILRSLSPLSVEVSPILHGHIACDMMELTLIYGQSPATPHALAHYGVFLVHSVRRYGDAARLAAAARRLLLRVDHAASAAHVLNVGTVAAGFAHTPRELEAWARWGRRTGIDAGDIVFESLNAMQILLLRIAAADDLVDIEREAATLLGRVRALSFSYGVDLNVCIIDTIAVLRADTAFAQSLEGPDITRARGADPFAGQSFSWSRYARAALRLYGAYFTGDLTKSWQAARAVLAAGGAAPFAPAFILAELLVGATAARIVGRGIDDDAELRAVHQQKSQLFVALARNAPDVFGPQLAVLDGLGKVLAGQTLDALRAYERAAELARTQQLHHVEAISHELAADLLRAQNLQLVADAHAGAAQRAHTQWCAEAAAAKVMATHPGAVMPRSENPVASPPGPAELDVMTLTKASQAIAGELVFEPLTRLLVRLVVEHAAAQRGCLVLHRGHHLVAEASFDLAGTARTGYSEAVARYVARTGRPLVLADASHDARFTTDPYMRTHKLRSVLAVPIKRKLVTLGVLVLENDLVAGAFTSERVTLVEHLAAQAAISLENARLYRELDERAADLRRTAVSLSAVEDAERRRIARDLHDSIGQSIPAVKLRLERHAAEVPHPLLDDLATELGNIQRQVRTLTFELYPPMLDDLGLFPALEHFARGLGAVGIEVALVETGSRAPLPSALLAFLFRAVKELLQNVARHARAAQVLVTLRWREDSLRIVCSDDGQGFDVAATLRPGARRGLGLFDLQERVAHLGGRLQIDSTPGVGTEVAIDIRIEPATPRPDASHPEEEVRS